MSIRMGLVLAAVALAGCGVETQTEISSPTADVQAVASDASVETVSFKIESMHCPFACWPKVRDTLNEQPGVAGVELAPQQDENAIDNPVVYVKSSGGFDSEKAIAALAEAGFDDAQLTAAQ